MTHQQSITCTLVPESERLSTVDALFGINYVLRLEPAVFGFAETCAEHFHLLREFMMGYAEVKAILRAID